MTMTLPDYFSDGAAQPPATPSTEPSPSEPSQSPGADDVPWECLEDPDDAGSSVDPSDPSASQDPSQDPPQDPSPEAQQTGAS
jgi:hypothetical protein